MSDESLLWLHVLPHEGRKAVGFVDYGLDSDLPPRLPDDEAYMLGWNEAAAIATPCSDAPSISLDSSPGDSD